MLTPEQKARQIIDEQLQAAGWHIFDSGKQNFSAGMGVAIREFQTSTGPADYALFVDRKLVGIIEAKPEGTSRTAVAEQTVRYLTSTTKFLQRAADQLPFGYEANGDEVRFCDWRDPLPRSRNVFSFHRPETLRTWLADGDFTLRHRLQSLPVLTTAGLRDCQVEAIRNLEESFKHATGPGP
ncbi:type I restriction endonuclease [Hymenobacter sp. B81]|uniref:type I restriction endonuclease n=1 Tax=Hymenobacter sp. B81 TaxID=3344878 RepID=UPI0037DC37AD